MASGGRSPPTDSELRYLKASTESLDLGISEVTDEGLAALTRLRNLKSLSLAVGFSDAGLVHVKGLSSLQRLSLRGSKVTDAGLKHLTTLAESHAWILVTRRVGNLGLKHLGSLTALRYLDLTKTGVTDSGLDCLRGLTGLQRLVLNHTKVTTTGLECLTGSRNSNGWR